MLFHCYITVESRNLWRTITWEHMCRVLRMFMCVGMAEWGDMVRVQKVAFLWTFYNVWSCCSTLNDDLCRQEGLGKKQGTLMRMDKLPFFFSSSYRSPCEEEIRASKMSPLCVFCQFVPFDSHYIQLLHSISVLMLLHE